MHYSPPCSDARRGIGSILIVCQVPVRISSGSDALVHLDELDGIPLDVFACQCVKHQPRSAAAAQTCDEAAPRSYRSPGFRCNENSGRARGCCGIGKYFDLHRRTSFSVGHSLLAAPCRACASRGRPTVGTLAAPAIVNGRSVGPPTLSTGPSAELKSSWIGNRIVPTSFGRQ